MTSQDSKNYQQEYKKFFESDAGLFLQEQITKLIAFNHERGENDPDHARDFMQRAKGNREALTHIKIVINGVSKGKNM